MKPETKGIVSDMLFVIGTLVLLPVGLLMLAGVSLFGGLGLLLAGFIFQKLAYRLS